MRTYWVYMLASRSRRLYVGVTNNIARRLDQHRNGKVEFTACYHVNRLVFVENTSDVAAAITREKQIKGWTRARKIALISAKNPTWDDLSVNISPVDNRQ